MVTKDRHQQSHPSQFSLLQQPEQASNITMRLPFTTNTFASALLASLLTVCACAQTPAPPQHPTSTPYAGDLSIFEDPGRAERPADRPRDGPACTEARQGGRGHRRRRRLVHRARGASASRPAARSSPKTSTRRPSTPSASAPNAKTCSTSKTFLGTPDDPKLAPDSLDAALMLKVYHEIAHPQTVLANLRAAMTPRRALRHHRPQRQRRRPRPRTRRSSAPRSSARASSRSPATTSPRPTGRTTS